MKNSVLLFKSTSESVVYSTLVFVLFYVWFWFFFICMSRLRPLKLKYISLFNYSMFLLVKGK